MGICNGTQSSLSVSIFRDGQDLASVVLSADNLDKRPNRADPIFTAYPVIINRLDIPATVQERRLHSWNTQTKIELERVVEIKPDFNQKSC